MPNSSPEMSTPPHAGINAVLVLANGEIFWGYGIGATGDAVGEVCFNTSMTGYQEILTDPSYAGQIITFTFPHIGNVGVNDEDLETTGNAANGLIIRADITEPANWRATNSLNDWLMKRNLVGISGIDTRRLTRLIRDSGAPMRWVPGGQGMALGFVYVGSNLGGALVPRFANAVAAQASWREALVWLGVVAVIAILPFAFFGVREPPTTLAHAAPGRDVAGSDADLDLAEALRTRSFFGGR